MEQQIQRIQLLFSQSRYKEAEKMLLEFLESYPNLEYAQYLLAIAITNQGRHQEAYELIMGLCELNPGVLEYLELKAEIEIASDNLEAAEDTVNHLIKSDAEDDDHYFLMARIKNNQRNYDRALEFANKTLSINPDHIGALNLSMTINSLLGNVQVAQQRIREALQRNPENPYTIANHGLSLLNEGKTKAALEKFKEALSLNPNNDIARYGMVEALKSKFWPYKLMYKFGLLLGRLSGKNMWLFIIGSYFGFRLLSSISERNPALQPYLNPLIIIIAAFFISTWILDPLMNAYLLTNKYGRFLLDDNSKRSAKLSIISILLSLVSIGLYFWSGHDVFMYGAILFFALLIPLGTMYKPLSSKNQKRAISLTITIAISGVLGLLLYFIKDEMVLLYAAFLGIFAYQWIINGMMISDSARRFGD